MMFQGYKVYFTLAPSDPMSSWSLHSVDATQLTTISGLGPNQTYTVSVVAYTSVGDGPPSEPLVVKTQLGGTIHAASPFNNKSVICL